MRQDAEPGARLQAGQKGVGYTLQARWAREVDTGRRWSWIGKREAWRRGRAKAHRGSRAGGDNASRGGRPAWQKRTRDESRGHGRPVGGPGTGSTAAEAGTVGYGNANRSGRIGRAAR